MRYCAWVLTALIVVGCASIRVSAQESKSESSDEKTLKILKDEAAKGAGGAGLVFVGATVHRTNNYCAAVQITVGPVVDGKYRPVPILGMHKSLLSGLRNFGPKALKAGRYYIGSVTCQQIAGTDRGSTTFSGPYARFEVRAGELVDVGSLRLEYTAENILLGRGKIRLSVEPTNQERFTQTQKVTPKVMTKLVKRHMAVIKPAERQVKRPGLF
jgi:hypothetical protein